MTAMNYLMSYWTKMFNYYSRISRTEFFVGTIGNALILWVLVQLMAFVLGFFGGTTGADEGTIEALALLIGFIGFVVYSVAYVSALNRRLRDTRFSPWWTVATFLPILQIVPFVFSFWPSQLKGNEMQARSYTRT